MSTNDLLAGDALAQAIADRYRKRIAELEAHLAALIRAGEPFEKYFDSGHIGAPSPTREDFNALAAALAKAREAKPK